MCRRPPARSALTALVSCRQTRSEYRRFFSSCGWLPECLRPAKTKEPSSFYSSHTNSNTQTTHAAGSPSTVGTQFTFPPITLTPAQHLASLKHPGAPPVEPHHLHNLQYHHHHHHYPTGDAGFPLGSEPDHYAEPYPANNYSPPTSERHSHTLSRSSSLLLKGRRQAPAAS